jgi:hypothetical protein
MHQKGKNKQSRINNTPYTINNKRYAIPHNTIYDTIFIRVIIDFNVVTRRIITGYTSIPLWTTTGACGAHSGPLSPLYHETGAENGIHSNILFVCILHRNGRMVQH